MKKKRVFTLFVATILMGFLIEVFSPEIQKIGLSARVVNGLGAGLLFGGLTFFALNWYKAE